MNSSERYVGRRACSRFPSSETPGSLSSTVFTPRASGKRSSLLCGRSESGSSIRSVDAGVGQHPPVFYGGKPGKSLTATAIIYVAVHEWKVFEPFARYETATT